MLYTCSLDLILVGILMFGYMCSYTALACVMGFTGKILLFEKLLLIQYCIISTFRIAESLFYLFLGRIVALRLFCGMWNVIMVSVDNLFDIISSSLSGA